jgi:uncharacterized protein
MKKLVPQNALSAADKDQCQTTVKQTVAANLLEKILIQASDPETSPAILSTLSKRKIKEICRRVAENPNTPEIVLKRLWIRYPLAMLENPIVAFRFLEGSKSFTKDLPTEVRLALYEALCSEGRFSEMEEHVPASSRCDWFNYNLDYIVKTNVAPFSDVLDFSKRLYSHIAVDPSSAVRKWAAGYLDYHFVLPMAADEDVKVRLALAKRASQHRDDGKVCEILSLDPSVEVRKVIAHSKNLPTSAHERLAEDSSRDVRFILAKEGGCIPGGEGGWRTLVKEGKELSVLVASNKCCPKSVLLDLVSHFAADVRLSAWNTYAFEKEETKKETDQLNALLADPSRLKERTVVAVSPTITGKICRRLLVAEVEVTRALASNRVISEAERIDLLLGADEQTSLLAIKCTDSVSVLAAACNHPSVAVRACIPLKGGKAIQILPNLAKDPSKVVRQSVCAYLTKQTGREYRSSFRQEALALLSKDPVEAIRLKVAQFLYADWMMLDSLSRDESVKVRVKVAEHSNAGDEILDRLAQDDSVEVRLQVAAHLDASDETLDRLAQDDAVEVRVRVAARRYLSNAILDRLSQDDSVAVRVSVARCFSRFSRAICDQLFLGPSRWDDIVLWTWVSATWSRHHERWPRVVRGWPGRVSDQHDQEVKGLALAEMLKKERLLHLRLARDLSPQVRAAVAGSVWTSPGALAVLIDDADEDVRDALLARSLPRTWDQEYRWCQRFGVEGGFLGNSENPYLRAIAANQRLTGKRWLRRLAEDDCWYVQAIAKRTLLDVIREAAKQGDARAQFNLGYAYDFGEGVAKDQVEAVKWYRVAAEQGNATAQNNLGYAYFTGEGVAKDAVESVKWWRKAAEQGIPAARHSLGKAYFTGEGVAKDAVEGVKWWRKASRQGNPGARYRLGKAYATGEGVAKDQVKAVKWYRKVAEQGLAPAQVCLGVAYYQGEGVAKDPVEAYAWINLAAVTDEEAKKQRVELEKVMTAQQVADGQKRSAELIMANQAKK